MRAFSLYTLHTSFGFDSKVEQELQPGITISKPVGPGFEPYLPRVFLVLHVAKGMSCLLPRSGLHTSHTTPLPKPPRHHMSRASVVILSTCDLYKSQNRLKLCVQLYHE